MSKRKRPSQKSAANISSTARAKNGSYTCLLAYASLVTGSPEMGEARRRLALAIIEHLQSEVKDGTITNEMEESVEVAIDCLAQCYELNLEDRDSLDKIRVRKNLMVSHCVTLKQ
jgi:hypothetical protein